MIRFVDFNFSSAHFYFQPKWSDVENKKNFGACYDPYGHGHNYKLEVGFENLEEKDVSLVRNQVDTLVKALDHHHLNHHIPEFSTKIPTTENIALYLSEKIKTLLPDQRLKTIRLWETEDIWAEVHFE